MKLYRLDRVRRVFGDRTVLDIDTLEILPHKIYTLNGQNGAGKTSLLKILAFLDIPTSGTIQFQDQPLHLNEKTLQRARKNVVLLDQTPIMFTGTVEKNVTYGLKIRSLRKSECREKVQRALELVGMEPFIDYDARALSGGETKRVALARALVLEPDVLLCDEPTANVDGENQEIILSIIEKINREQNTSIIFSTHYLSQGQRLAHHTLALQHGRLREIVSENIFRTNILDNQNGQLLCQLTGHLLLKLPSKKLQNCRDTVKIHIDPAKIICNPENSAYPENLQGNTLQGHITELAQENGKIRAQVRAGVNLVVHLPIDQYYNEKPAIGEKVMLFIPHESVEFIRVDSTFSK